MNEPVPWSVWIARVLFEEGNTFKNRPVIILNNNTVLCMCDVLAVTSKPKSNRHVYRIKNTECIKLTKESYVKLSAIELKHDDLCEFLGMLDKRDRMGLISSMQAGCYGSMFCD